MPPSLQPLYDYSSSATFTYAADGQRRKMQIGNTTTVYCDDYQVNKNGSTEQRLHYISGPAGLCALIVQNGDFSFTTQGNYWYVAPGSINSTNGWYSIGMSSDGTVFYRCFSTYYPFAK
ncbi:MAG: hypothetical protein IJ911_03150 [Salinivirgaceae bacterium]|nr:hypothetical protein [Salinivirgaceae bacterium]